MKLSIASRLTSSCENRVIYETFQSSHWFLIENIMINTDFFLLEFFSGIQMVLNCAVRPNVYIYLYIWFILTFQHLKIYFIYEKILKALETYPQVQISQIHCSVCFVVVVIILGLSFLGPPGCCGLISVSFLMTVLRSTTSVLSFCELK